MIRLWAVPVLLLIMPGTGTAHHGFGSFDAKRDIEITGKITKIDFINPHSWLYLDVTSADGAVEAYRCEMRPATGLRRAGWKPSMFVVGETITVQGSPSRTDPNSCFAATLIFADGSTMDRYGQRTEGRSVGGGEERPLRLPNGDLNFSGDWAPEQVIMTDPRGLRGAFVPMSVAETVAPGEVPEGFWPQQRARGVSYFDLAIRFLKVALRADVVGGQALRALLDTVDIEPTPLGEAASKASDLRRCELRSILGSWQRDVGDQSTINRITQNENTITIEYGHLGTTRIIHMDTDQHPSDLEATRTGHSIGRWENDVLLVDTVGFAPGPLLGRRMHGEQLHVVERFSLDPKDMALTREWTADDPEYLVGEARGSDEVFHLSDTPYVVDPCEELPVRD